MSKCNGGLVWPEPGCKAPWEQITTFDPRPHHYNTLNLPSWELADYPVLNQTRVNKNCDWYANSSLHGYVDMINTHYVSMRPGGNKVWTAESINFNDYNKYSNGAELFYGGNAFHWDNNNRGALNLYWDSNTAHDNGFQIGRSLYPSSVSHDREIYDPARWMDGVYGIQFEWDSGRPFGADGHDSDTTNQNSKGYQLQDLVMTYVIVGSDGKVLKDCALVLVKDKDLMPGICYWWRGYSLLNGDETWGASGGQGMESTDPRRSGKCGFAIDCRESGFDMLRNCTWDGTKFYGGHEEEAKQVYLYSNNPNHADDPDDDHRNCTPATRCIWTSTFVGFHTNNDGSWKRKNFRMWNAKPITVPVIYETSNRHDPDSLSDVGNRGYYPYNHTNCPVIHDPTYGGPPSDGSFEQVVPAVYVQDDHPSSTYLKNGVVAREMNLSKGSGDASMPIMHNTTDSLNKPYGWDRATISRGHLGMPPAGSTGGKDS